MDKEASIVTRSNPTLVSTVNGESGKYLYGELRTKIGSVRMTDESTIELAINHLTVLLQQIKNTRNQKLESHEIVTNPIPLPEASE